MAKYIDTNKVLDQICDIVIYSEDTRKVKEEAIKIIVNMLPADVVPMRHGHWKHDAGIWSNFEMCSLCKKWTKSSMEYDYCPNCGAKMDLKGDTDNE